MVPLITFWSSAQTVIPGNDGALPPEKQLNELHAGVRIAGVLGVGLRVSRGGNPVQVQIRHATRALESMGEGALQIWNPQRADLPICLSQLDELSRALEEDPTQRDQLCLGRAVQIIRNHRRKSRDLAAQGDDERQSRQKETQAPIGDSSPYRSSQHRHHVDQRNLVRGNPRQGVWRHRTTACCGGNCPWAPSQLHESDLPR